MRYKVKKRPAKWISAHRTNEYTIILESHSIFGTYDASGYLGFVTTTALDSPAVGDRIYIYAGAGSSGTYTGYHIIREVISTIQIVTETDYVGYATGSNTVSQIVLPTISLYKGYTDGEIILPYDSGTIDLYDIQPYELVAEFQPETNLDGEIVFDFSGYTKAIIESPYKAGYNYDENDYTYALSHDKYIPMNYSRIKLILNGCEIGYHYCANASITTDELNRDYVDTDRQMQPLLQPVNYYGQYYKGDYIEQDLQKRKII